MIVRGAGMPEGVRALGIELWELAIAGGSPVRVSGGGAAFLCCHEKKVLGSIGGSHALWHGRTEIPFWVHDLLKFTCSIIAEYHPKYHGIYHQKPNINSWNKKTAPLSQAAECICIGADRKQGPRIFF